MLQTLDAYIDRLAGLGEEEKDRLFEEAKQIIGSDIWIPNPGPQTGAYYSEADLLLYGGQGGGGKTDLIAGLALTQHQRSLLLRPQYTDLGALIERVVAIAGTRKGLNSAPPAQFKTDDRVVDFGAAGPFWRSTTSTISTPCSTSTWTRSSGIANTTSPWRSHDRHGPGLAAATHAPLPCPADDAGVAARSRQQRGGLPRVAPSLRSALYFVGGDTMIVRGLSRTLAAEYIGISPRKFDTMVECGEMPSPKRIGKRKVWDRVEVDEYFDALPTEGGDKGNSWDAHFEN